MNSDFFLGAVDVDTVDDEVKPGRRATKHTVYLFMFIGRRAVRQALPHTANAVWAGYRWHNRRRL